MRLPWIVAILIGLSAVFAFGVDAPLSPTDAPKHMTLPPGFKATLFAGEPDVVQPISFTFDDRGRLWVAECNSYPQWQTDPTQPGKDRILIFEDDGTGHFSNRKVFLDHISNLTSIEWGFGGVWMISLPNLVFIPVTDDKPAGPPQVILDGWSVQAKHNVANRLTWGPDGWLWGLHGILAESNVGEPGAPDSKRTKINCCVWRVHPVNHKFEVVATGTTNPWGLDFDDFGEAFITNCVIKHLWHVIPGAHYQRMYGQDYDADAYGLMESCADHIHWAGGDWTTARGGAAHSEAGGGHAHAGAMVYLGDNWPDSYRDSIFISNIHGNRINNDRLEHKGSGYVGRHGADFMLANDPWFRGLNLAYGPDGGVYISDWTDTGECHNYSAVDRTNGRIFKVTWGDTKAVHPDLDKLTDEELVALQLHKNDWYVRHARRLLEERAAACRIHPSVIPPLLKILRENTEVSRRLRALWTINSIKSEIKGQLATELLADRDEHIRAWTIRLCPYEPTPSPELLQRFALMARTDPSPVVRLSLASTLQHLPIENRWPIAEALITHGEDATDANLPLMIWYGIEPLAKADSRRAASLAATSKIPLIREFLARQLAVAGN